MNHIFKKIIFLTTLLLICSSCNKKIESNKPTPPLEYSYSQILKINDQFLNIEIAKTLPELEHGLSNRASMENNQGMLFDFGTTPSSPKFWMKDMKFNLDLIWILKNKIVGITENVPVPSCNSSLETCHLPTYPPPSPITQVLEVNADWSKINNIKVGDEILLIK